MTKVPMGARMHRPIVQGERMNPAKNEKDDVSMTE